VSEEAPRPVRSRLRELYFGHTQTALRFQGLLFILDVAIVGFFIFAQFIGDPAWFWIVDACIAVFLIIDMSSRLYALGTVRRWLLYPSNWADIVVLATLVVPAFANLGFLRILRLWTLVHRERFWNVLGGGRWDDTHVEDLTQAVFTLITFIFVAAGVTQALFLRQHPQLNNFVDAIYFVVSSLTTTGYGDIVLSSALGRLFSAGLMIAGISLFLSIAQKLVSTPQKVAPCGDCGLDRHDIDAKHCKVCGSLLGPRLRGRARGARG